MTIVPLLVELVISYLIGKRIVPLLVELVISYLIGKRTVPLLVISYLIGKRDYCATFGRIGKFSYSKGSV